MSVVLHDSVRDDKSYRVRLMLAFLGVTFTRVPVEGLRNGAIASFAPGTELPVLEDGDLVLQGSDAILTYLARRYDVRDTWLPADDPVLFGQTMMWISFASDALRPVSLARRQALFGVPDGETEAIEEAGSAFAVMEDHMALQEQAGSGWFVGRTPTVADVALFPPVALSHEVGIDHHAYPALRRWVQRVRALPGFRTMPGIPDYDEIDGLVCPRMKWKN